MDIFAMRRMEEDLEVLADSADLNPYTSVGFIIWYTLLVLCCFVPMVCCCFAFTRAKCRETRLDNQRELDAEISRMEANIVAFSIEEQNRKRALLKRAFEPFTKVGSVRSVCHQHSEHTQREFGDC